MVEYDPEWVDQYGVKWTDAKVREEIEDIGFEAEIVEVSEEDEVELRVYG